MTRFTTFVSLLTIALALLLAACAPYETRPAQTLDMKTLSIPEYREFLTELTAAIAQGEPRELNAREKDRFQRITGRLDRVLASHQSVDEMDHDTQTQLFNLHNELEAVVVGRDEDQLLCRREHRVGTNFRVTECKTVSQWREEQDIAQRHLRGAYMSHLAPPE